MLKNSFTMACEQTKKHVFPKSCESCGNCEGFRKRILITGGCGFMGSHLVIHLVQKYPDYFIINLDKLDYCASLKHLEPINDARNYKFIQGDICEADFIRYIFAEQRPDIVIHLAAQSHVDQSFWSSLDFTRTNVYGTHVLINSSHEAGVSLFIHVSTDEVYGGNSTSALKESANFHPTNPYAASKAAAECIVRSYWESFQFPVIITRANNIYGPHQYPEKKHLVNDMENIIPKFISLLQWNKKCCLHGDGSTRRNFLYVSDITSAYDVLLHHGVPGEVYNIGTDFEISMKDLANVLIKKLTDAETEEEMKKHIEYVPDRPFNDLRYPMDTSKLQGLGWQPEVTWEEGLNTTIDWYKEKSNFYSWPQVEQALSPYPPGSNTMRLHSRNSESS